MGHGGEGLELKLTDSQLNKYLTISVTALAVINLLFN